MKIIPVFILISILISGCEVENESQNDTNQNDGISYYPEQTIPKTNIAYINLGFDKSDPEQEIVSLDDIYVFSGRLNSKPNNKMLYELKVLSEDRTEIVSIYLPVVYFILVSCYSPECDSMIERNTTFVIPELEYTQNWETIEVHRNETLIFETNVGELLCNENSICDAKENYYSCPQNCLKGGSDGICDKELDEICDTDCYTGVDPDCV